MKTVKKYSNTFSAHVAKGVLEASGISAFVLNENMAMITGAVNTDLLSIQLVVENSLYEKAVEILKNVPEEE